MHVGYQSLHGVNLTSGLTRDMYLIATKIACSLLAGFTSSLLKNKMTKLITVSVLMKQDVLYTDR